MTVGELMIRGIGAGWTASQVAGQRPTTSSASLPFSHRKSALQSALSSSRLSSMRGWLESDWI
jgi:hypothetical protein